MAVGDSSTSSGSNNSRCQGCDSILQGSPDEMRVGQSDVKVLYNEAQNGCTGCALLVNALRAGGVEPNVSRLVCNPWDSPAAGLCFKFNSFASVIELFTVPGTFSPWNKIQARTEISGDTSSEASLDMIRSKLKICENQHSTCKSAEQYTLPRRVLALGASNSDIHLHDSAGENSRYACLSHCWGKGSRLMTTRTNLQDHKRSIPWDAFPATFRDAIITCRRLGISYLWIDSLCIIQDDPADWQEEAGKMAIYYPGAWLTIAGSHAKDSSAGLFTGVAPGSCPVRRFETPDELGRLVKVSLRRALPHYGSWPTQYQGKHLTNEDMWPLMTRSWAFQELMLSPRILHFGRMEVIWECRELTACECGSVPKNIRGDKALLSLTDVNLFSAKDQWLKIIEVFNQRKLTFSTDRFPALSGIAKHFRQHMAGRYLAGVWEDDLKRSLLWQTCEGSRRPRGWVAPTWSWASIEEAPVTYPWLPPATDRQVIEVLEAHCTLATSDPMGVVSEGHLVVEGSAIDAFLSLSPDWRLSCHIGEKLVFEEGHRSKNATPEAGSNDWLMARIADRLAPKGVITCNFDYNLEEGGVLSPGASTPVVFLAMGIDRLEVDDHYDRSRYSSFGYPLLVLISSPAGQCERYERLGNAWLQREHPWQGSFKMRRITIV